MKKQQILKHLTDYMLNFLLFFKADCECPMDSEDGSSLTLGAQQPSNLGNTP